MAAEPLSASISVSSIWAPADGYFRKGKYLYVWQSLPMQPLREGAAKPQDGCGEAAMVFHKAALPNFVRRHHHLNWPPCQGHN